MARRVIQFPVRNAFTAERTRDALERDEKENESLKQAHRIASKVEQEIARIAERQATGHSASLEAARSQDVIVMQPTSRVDHLRKRITSLPAGIRAFATQLFTRR